MSITNTTPKRKFDLEQRTYVFAQNVRNFIKEQTGSIYKILPSDYDQLLRSSGSVGANYIEANEAMSQKDFAKHIKICRKEAKESWYWLRLIRAHISPASHTKIGVLIQEAHELQLIFGSITRSLNYS